MGRQAKIEKFWNFLKKIERWKFQFRKKKFCSDSNTQIGPSCRFPIPYLVSVVHNLYSWKNEKSLWNLETFTALDQDRTQLSKKVLIILSFICGLTPSQIRELKLKDLYKVISVRLWNFMAGPKKPGFCSKHTCSKEKSCIFWIQRMAVCQKLEMILENKVLQNWKWL